MTKKQKPDYFNSIRSYLFVVLLMFPILMSSGCALVLAPLVLAPGGYAIYMYTARKFDSSVNDADNLVLKGKYRDAIKHYEKIIFDTSETLVAKGRKFRNYQKWKMKEVFVREKLADVYLEVGSSYKAITLLVETQEIINQMKEYVPEKEREISEKAIKRAENRVSHLLEDAISQQNLSITSNVKADYDSAQLSYERGRQKDENGISNDDKDSNEDLVSVLYIALKNLNDGAVYKKQNKYGKAIRKYERAKKYIDSLVRIVPESYTLKALALYACLGLKEISKFSNDEFNEVLNKLKTLKKDSKYMWDADKLTLFACAKVEEHKGINVESPLKNNQHNLVIQDALTLYEKSENTSIIIDFELNGFLSQPLLNEQNAGKESSNISISTILLKNKLNDLERQVNDEVRRVVKRLKYVSVVQPKILVDPHPWEDISPHRYVFVTGRVTDEISVKEVLVNGKKARMSRSKGNFGQESDIVFFASEVDLVSEGNDILIEASYSKSKKTTKHLSLKFSETYSGRPDRTPQFEKRWALFFDVHRQHVHYISSQSGNKDNSYLLMNKLCQGIPPYQIVKRIDKASTKNNIEKSIKNVVMQSKDSGVEEILIYLNLECIDIYEKGQDGTFRLEPYLLPSDVNYAELRKTSINMRSFFDQLLKQDCKAKKILVITNIENAESRFKTINISDKGKLVILSAAKRNRANIESLSYISIMLNELKRLSLYDTAQSTFWYKETPPSFFDLFNETAKKVERATAMQQQPDLSGDVSVAQKFILPGIDFHKKLYDELADLFRRSEISHKAYLRALNVIYPKNDHQNKQDKEIADYLKEYLEKPGSNEELNKLLENERLD